MSDLYIDRVFELDFWNGTYILHLVVSPSGLVLDLEKKATGEIWVGEFSAEKLEENSQKTGNFKKYPVFVQMVVAAINGSNDSVELDLMTYSDLEKLKAKKQSQSQGKPHPNQPLSQNNLYLLLNYVVEFDKVHYPLQLVFQEVPSADRQKQTIKRLRSEISVYQKDSQSPQELVSENMNLKQENEMYKLRIKKIQESQNRMIQAPQIQVQEKVVVKEVRDTGLEREHGQLKLQLEASESQLSICRAKLEHRQGQNQELKEEIERLKEEMVGDSESKEVKYEKDIKRVEQRLCKEFNEQLKSVSKHTQQLVVDLKETREENKRQKSRILELEKELSMMVKRNLSKEKIGVSSTLISTKRSETPRSTNKSKQKSLSKSKVSSNFNSSYLKTSKSKEKPRQSGSKRKSVMDSDTESSRMRRMNNQNVSPYRTGQAMKRVPSNKSFKASSPKSNRSQPKSQTKSNSKSQSRKQSQQSLNSSQVFTQSQSNFQNNFPSDSQDQSHNRVMEMLRKNREEKMKKGKGYGDKNITAGGRGEKGRVSNMERQISSIAEMLKQSRKELAD